MSIYICMCVWCVCLPIEPKQTSFFILANHSLCVVGFLSMLIMCEEFTFIVHTPSQEQCRRQQLVGERTGCLENRRPRRIRQQQQKQLQWLSAAGAEDVYLLCCQISSLHCTMQIVSTRVESPGSSHPWQDAAWHLGQTLLSISRAIKALNLFGLRCEASDKQAIRREITLCISLLFLLSLFSNASSLQSRRRQDVPDRQRRYELEIRAFPR